MIWEILLMSHVHSLHSSEVFIIWYRVIVVGVLCQCRYCWGERLFLLNKLSIIFIICRWNCWDCHCGAISFYINLSYNQILFSSRSMYLCLALSYASTSCCTTLFINASNWLVHLFLLFLLREDDKSSALDKMMIIWSACTVHFYQLLSEQGTIILPSSHLSSISAEVSITKDGK